MKVVSWLLLAAGPSAAHMISMSTGELDIRGVSGHYELRIPVYEVAHIKDAERTIWQHIHFRAAGIEARLESHACREDAGAGAYFCAGEYRFAAPVERLEVECTLHAITVPNHVHLLRARREGQRDQALFDAAYSHATLRFEPPGAGERAISELGAGAKRAIGGLMQILFLACLVLAARGRRELVALAATFLFGQVLSALVVPAAGWRPSAGFVEAAAALAVAYLAVEILLLPKAGARWAVACVLGALHGLYFALFLETSEYRAAWVLAGALFTEILIVAALAPLFARLAQRPVQVSASVLLVIGMVWFFVRVTG